MAATSVKKSRPAPTGMPIEGYDHLSVKAILPELAILTGPELKAVAAHEKAGKNRVTLLRAVRQVELAREAASSRNGSTAGHLTIVDDPTEPPTIPERVSVPERRSRKAVGTGAAVRPSSTRKNATPTETEPEPGFDTDTGFDSDFDSDFDSEFEPQADLALAEFEADVDDDVAEVDADIDIDIDADADLELAEFEAEFEAEVASEFAPEPPAPTPVLAKKKSRSKPAAKAATWEEEPRPELPRRIQSMAYDLDPPVIALAPDLDTDLAGPVADASSIRGPRPSAPAKVARKFEGAALVMAAILAVLLGLAIGTILTRGGSTSASGAPSVSAQVVYAPPAG